MCLGDINSGGSRKIAAFDGITFVLEAEVKNFETEYKHS